MTFDSDPYLSYSGYKKFVSCPRAYWHTYVNKTPAPEPDNRVNSLYGTIVGALFETLYKKRLWRNPTVLQELQDLVVPVYERTLESEKKKKGGLSLEGPGCSSQLRKSC